MSQLTNKRAHRVLASGVLSAVMATGFAGASASASYAGDGPTDLPTVTVVGHRTTTLVRLAEIATCLPHVAQDLYASVSAGGGDVLESKTIDVADFPWVPAAEGVGDADGEEVKTAAMTALTRAYQTVHGVGSVRRGDLVTFEWQDGSSSVGLVVSLYSSVGTVPVSD